MPQDILDFLKNDYSQKKDYIIDQLISHDGYGIIAGRTGLGKTNLLLNLSIWLAKGYLFFIYPLKRLKVGYFAFEGGEANIQDRYKKICTREGAPEAGWLDIARIDPFVLSSQTVGTFKQLIKPYDMVIFDPVKWMVGRNYTQPDTVSEFTKVFTGALHQEGKIGMLSQQVKKSDPRHKLEPGDLWTLKGAADYVEDATFALLLERTELRGKNIPAHAKDRFVTLYLPKHREAVEELPAIDLEYDFNKCEFEVMP